MIVRDSAVDRTAGFEGFVEHFYLDTTGNVTIGYGHMVPTAAAAAALPLKDENGRDATAQAKRDEWTLIKSKPPGKRPSYYKPFTKLTLPVADAKALLRKDLEAAAKDVKTRFPKIDDYPEDAQDALLDMMFNLGLTKFSRANWTNLFAAVDKEDWKTAASECHRSDVQDVRNDAIRDLFLSAAEKFLDLHVASRLVDQSFKNRINEVLEFVSAGQKFDKFFPNGITKVKLDVTVSGIKIEFELVGPDQGKPSAR